MRKLAFMMIINSISFYIASRTFSSVKLEGLQYAVMAGLILTLLYVMIRPLVVIVALPVNILTLGLFTIVINTCMVMLADWFVSGLQLSSFWVAMAVAVGIMVVNRVIKPLQGGKGMRRGA